MWKTVLSAVLVAQARAVAAQSSYPFPEAKSQTSPAPQTSVPVAPPRLVPTIPVAPPPAPLALPRLSEVQSATIRAWLADLTAEGLARTPKASDATNVSGDALALAALDRARALHSGRLDSGDFLQIWALRPAAWDPAPGFADAVARDRLPQWIASLTPPYTGYDGLRRGLKTYLAIEAAGGWQALPAVDLTSGATGKAVAALRARLVIEDRDVDTAGTTYDARLREAVVRAQRRYGLNPTGNLNAETRAALNVAVGDRIGAIMANLERWRWLPRELPTRRIQVNIAAAVLTVFEGDQPVQSMRAVTGRPGDETPMLQSKIHSIVVNPPWNVPAGIAAREYWPKERANPGYLAARGFKIIGSPETGQRLQQAAGEQSALGRLKFDFDNPFAVYLHDTPSRAKFDSYDRLASHGCVRLQHPVDLAERLLAGDAKWTGQVQAGIDAGPTVRVPLAQPVAVYLLYWTAFAGANGQVGFRADPYGWDKLLAGKIDARSRGVAPRVPAPQLPVEVTSR